MPAPFCKSEIKNVSCQHDRSIESAAASSDLRGGDKISEKKSKSKDTHTHSYFGGPEKQQAVRCFKETRKEAELRDVSGHLFPY